MPTYVFMCNNCRESFSLIMSISDHEKGNFICPTCEGKDVRQEITTFQTKTSRKS